MHVMAEEEGFEPSIRGIPALQFSGQIIGTFMDGGHFATSGPCGYWNTSSSGTPNTPAIWNAISSEGE